MGLMTLCFPKTWSGKSFHCSWDSMEHMQHTMWSSHEVFCLSHLFPLANSLWQEVGCDGLNEAYPHLNSRFWDTSFTFLLKNIWTSRSYTERIPLKANVLSVIAQSETIYLNGISIAFLNRLVTCSTFIVRWYFLRWWFSHLMDTEHKSHEP